MSFGHADKIAAIAAGAQVAHSDKPIDPALYRRDDVRRILASRDIAALYLVLKDEGITQRQIAALTRQSQSEVSEILKDRRVRDVTVLERIAEGLGIPREFMGLSWWGDDGTCAKPDGTYAEKATVADSPEDDEMRRRAVILSVPVALWGSARSVRCLSCPRPTGWWDACRPGWR